MAQGLRAHNGGGGDVGSGLVGLHLKSMLLTSSRA